MKRTLTLQPIRTAGGFTVIETLVALLLLGTCIIGIAALKAERVRPNDSSEQHAHAVALTKQVIQLIQSQHDPAIHFETTVGLVCEQQLKSPNAERLAANALACWQDKVEAELPNGTGAVSLDSKPTPPVYTITVNWSEPEIGARSYMRRLAAQ